MDKYFITLFLPLSLFVAGCGEDKAKQRNQSIEFHTKGKGPLFVNGVSFRSPHPDGGVELLYSTQGDDFRKDIHTGLFSPNPFTLSLNLREGALHLTGEFVAPGTNMIDKGYFGNVVPGDRVLIKGKQIFVNDELRESRPWKELPEAGRGPVPIDQWKSPKWPQGWTGVVEE